MTHLAPRKCDLLDTPLELYEIYIAGQKNLGVYELCVKKLFIYIATFIYVSFKLPRELCLV